MDSTLPPYCGFLVAVQFLGVLSACAARLSEGSLLAGNSPEPVSGHLGPHGGRNCGFGRWAGLVVRLLYDVGFHGFDASLATSEAAVNRQLGEPRRTSPTSFLDYWQIAQKGVCAAKSKKIFLSVEPANRNL